jgi:hypothetical protein
MSRKLKPGSAKSIVISKYPNAWRRRRLDLSEPHREFVHEIIEGGGPLLSKRVLGSGDTPKEAWESARAKIFAEVLAQ